MHQRITSGAIWGPLVMKPRAPPERNNTATVKWAWWKGLHLVLGAPFAHDVQCYEALIMSIIIIIMIIDVHL